MKRILFLLCALLGTVGAWAVDFTVSNPTQVTDLSTLSSDKFYVLKSNGGNGLYNYYDSESSQMSSKADYDYSCVVRLISSGDGYAIQQMNTMTYYQALSDGALVTLGANLIPYSISSAGEGLFFFDNNNLKLNTNNTGNKPQGASNTWTGAYSQWKIFEVEVYKTATIVDGVNAPYDTYGARNTGVSPQTFTSNAASGVAGIVISAPIIDRATWWSTLCLAIKNSASQTNENVTFEAPEGCIIENISMTIQAIASANPYDVTVNGETTRVTGAAAKEYNISVNAPKYSFIINSVSGVNWLAVKSMTIKLAPAIGQYISVTYNLYESDGTTLVTSVETAQKANSSINVPTSFVSSTYFDYATEGTISEEDCTIKVTRTPKNGIVYPITNLSNYKSYYIKTRNNARSSLSSYTDNGTTYLASPVKSALGISPKKFAILSYEDNYYLYSVEDAKFVTYSESQKAPLADIITGTSDRVAFIITDAPLYQPRFDGNSGKIFNSSASYTYGLVFNTWGGSSSQWDDGCMYTIEEADDFDPTTALAALTEFFHPSITVTYIVKDASGNTLFTSEPQGTSIGNNITTLPEEYQLTNFYTYNTVDVTIGTTGNTDVEFIATPKEDALVKYTADTSNPYYYNLNIRSKYLVYNSEATGEVTLQNASEPFNANASWAFVGEPYAGFKVINKTKGSDYCLTYTSVVTARHSDNNVQFVAATECTDKYWVIDTNKSGLVLRMKENPSIYFHHDNINNYLRTCSVSEWSAVHDDAGSTIEAVSDDDVLFALYDSMKDYIYGDGLGKYTATGITADQAQNTILQAGEVITDENTANYAEAYKALNDLKSITAINQPSAGFYRIKGVANNTYLSGNASVVEGKTDRLSFTTTTDASNIFYFDGAKLYDFAKGRAANGRDVGIVGATGMNYEFETSSSEAGKYAICFTPDDGNKRWLYAHSSGYADQNGAENQYCRYDLEEVNTLPVTISAAGYATLYAPVALTIPEGVTASTLTIGYKDHLDETNVEVTIPANTPVMLSGDNGNPATSGTYNFTIAEDVPAINQANKLIGTIAAIAAPDESYILQNHDGVVGFYLVETNEAKPNVPGFRAYIPASDSSVKAFFFGDTATGINAIKNASVDGEIYDLSGRRVSKMQRGVYVVGGKKVAVK